MLIAIPIWNPQRDAYTDIAQQVLTNLLQNVARPQLDRVIVSDNASCAEMHAIYSELGNKHANFSVIYNSHNLGIAEATNVAWRQATPDEIVVKMDSDCFIRTPGWPELVELVFAKDDSIGILGLKRRDCEESPTACGFYRSKLFYLKRKKGERWVPLEEVNHVMGTCYAFHPKMRREFGYLMQPGSVYGFDDSLAAVRAHKLGYKTCFLPQIDIDHLDPPNVHTNPYAIWKERHAGAHMAAYNNLRVKIESGEVSPYCEP